MALELNGTTGVSLVQDGVVTAADLASGAITSAALPAGSVLQVVSTTSDTDTSVQSTSYIDTGLSVSITPTLSSSKILVIVTQVYTLYKEAVNPSSSMKILGGATTLVEHTITPRLGADITGGASFVTGTWAGSYLDSPNTTSSITYKTQAKVDTTASNSVIRFQQSQQDSTIILMEIAG